MEIKQVISDQKTSILASIQKLAYDRLQHARAIEEIDANMKVLEGALQANEVLRKENDTIEAVAYAKKPEATKVNLKE